MTLALFLAALRRHPFSFIFTMLLSSFTASLLHVSALLALVAWMAATLLGLEVWYALEPFVLRKFAGLRDASHAERELIEPMIASAQLQLLISDRPDLSLARALRCLVISRDMLEIFDERSLSGLVHQAIVPVHRANLAGYLMVRLGNLPLVGAWLVGRLLVQCGRLLGIVVGQSLVVPLVLWPGGFVRWSGRILGAAIVGLLGAMLLSSGMAAPGLGILVGWLLVPGIQAVLAWESRRAVRAADRATIEAGFGSQLLEALDFLALAEPRTQPTGILGILCRPGATVIERAERIRRVLQGPSAEPDQA